MSYDIYLKDPETGKIIEFDEPHKMNGGTFALGGTTEAWLNVTWNYAPHFYKTMGDRGIRNIYGKTGKESIPLLDGAIGQLENDVDKDYWKSTEGNAKQALIHLRTMAEARPDGVWGGD